MFLTNLKKQTAINLTQMNNFLKIFILLLFFSCNKEGDLIDVKVCKHYNNADATIIQCSDQYYNQKATYNLSRQYSAEVAEYNALKYNIPIHVFEGKVEHGLKDYLEMGRGGVSAYFPSCSEEYSEIVLDSILNTLKTVYGKRPTTMAYGCGKTQYGTSLPNYILGGRNSSHGSPKALKKGIPVCTYYGKNSGDPSIYTVDSVSFIRNRLNASRSWANIISNGSTEEESLSFVKKEIEKTISNSGFYLDFMHWQIDEINGNNAQQFIPKLFKSMGEAINKSYTAKVDYNQAIEYFYGKEAIDSISLVEKTNFYEMSIYVKKKFDKIDYSLITTPISFETPISIEKANKLGGKNIKSITFRNGKTIINAFIDFTKPITKIIITKNKESKFLAYKFDVQQENNTILTTDLTKATFFQKNKKDYKVKIIKRSLNFSERHKFEFNTDSNNYDYYVGVINKLGESKLIKVE